VEKTMRSLDMGFLKYATGQTDGPTDVPIATLSSAPAECCSQHPINSVKTLKAVHEGPNT